MTCPHSGWMQHRVETARLLLRPLQQTDILEIHQAASNRDIADTMISVPHPYPEDEAQRFVEMQQDLMQKCKSLTFAIIDREEGGRFAGIVSIRDVEEEHAVAELSFWVATEGQGKGYMSEALPGVLDLAFGHLGLNRIYAYHMARNIASARVLEKCGLMQEGFLRQRVKKWGKYEDVVIRAMLKEDWLNASPKWIWIELLRFSYHTPAIGSVVGIWIVSSRARRAKRETSQATPVAGSMIHTIPRCWCWALSKQWSGFSIPMYGPPSQALLYFFFLAPESILTMIIMSHYESKKSCAALRGAQR